MVFPPDRFVRNASVRWVGIDRLRLRIICTNSVRSVFCRRGFCSSSWYCFPRESLRGHAHVHAQLSDLRPVHIRHEEAHLPPLRHMKRSDTSLFGVVGQHHRA